LKDDEIGEACSTNWKNRNACWLFVKKLEVKRPLRKPRRRWEDNIKMDLGEIAFGDVDWIGLTG
jgi:hypothetical protein